MAASSTDPLGLAGLEPEAIAVASDAKKRTSKKKEPTELELAKEARLAQKEARLNQLGAMSEQPSVNPPELQPTQSAPQVDKSSLLDKLSAYRERFPQLKKRNNVTAKSTHEEIMDELHHCEVQLGSSQTPGSGSGMLFYGAMVGLESFTRDVWNPMGLDLTGLGQVTKDNMQEFQPVLDELMIKYGTGLYVTPEVRLAIAVGSLVVTVHAANSGDPRLAESLKKMNQAVPTSAVGTDL